MDAVPRDERSGRCARSDLPAIELSLAVFLLASSAPELPVAGLTFGVLVMALALVKTRQDKTRADWRPAVVSAVILASGLAWGLMAAALLGVVGPATVLLGLAMVVAAALPAARDLTQLRLFTGAALAPGALWLLASADSRLIGLGGLVLVFSLLVEHIWRGLQPARPARAPDLSNLDVLERELRAVRVRQSWQVIDGNVSSAEAKSEKQQLRHQNAQRHI